MSEGEKAGCWAMVYLYMVLFAVWFTIASLVWFHVKEWLK